MIPKIIHQTAYANKDEWHPMWKLCQASILNNFKNFEYILWTDEDLDKFVKEKYPKLYEEYKNFDIHIFQLDCVRYLLLHYYGGIYIDMDIYCYENFYNELKKDINLVESSNDELVQNSLMASIPNHLFWIDCFNQCVHRTKIFKLKQDFSNQKPKLKTEKDENDDLIRIISGPILLSDCYSQNKYDINILSKTFFSHTPLEYNKKLKTKHMETGMWGKETKIGESVIRDDKKISLYEHYKYIYKHKTRIDLDNFDFYRDYNVK